VFSCQIGPDNKSKAQIHALASTNLGKTAGRKFYYYGAELYKLLG
jgi:hypothetical protein